MKTLNLLLFECKKQIKSLTFIFVIILFAIFAVTQLAEVFYLPIISEGDIEKLSIMSPDINQYVYVPNTDDTAVKALSIDFLRRQIDENTTTQTVTDELQAAIDMLEDDSYTLDMVIASMADYDYAPAWLMACKAQFSQRLATVEEANNTLLSSFGNRGYAPILNKNYVTYMQVILTFLIFPIFLFIFTRDYRHGMYEIVYAQPLSANKYLLLKYLSGFIPTAAFLYLLGIIFNLISAGRFMIAGFEYQYTFFTPYFLIYILPSLFFMSAVITVLMLLIRKAVAVLPIYIIYVLFNVTPRVFTFGNENVDWIYSMNPIIRLDHEFVLEASTVVLNRAVYGVLGVVIVIAACLLYKRLRKNMRGAITI